jgi:hypothetical protein
VRSTCPALLITLDLIIFFPSETSGRTHWMRHRPIVISLPPHESTNTKKTRCHTSMPRPIFEPTTPYLNFSRDYKSCSGIDMSSLCLRNCHNVRIYIYLFLRHEGVWGNESKAPPILNLSSRWTLSGHLYAPIVLILQEEPLVCTE